MELLLIGLGAVGLVFAGWVVFLAMTNSSHTIEEVALARGLVPNGHRAVGEIDGINVEIGERSRNQTSYLEARALRVAPVLSQVTESGLFDMVLGNTESFHQTPFAEISDFAGLNADELARLHRAHRDRLFAPIAGRVGWQHYDLVADDLMSSVSNADLHRMIDEVVAAAKTIASGEETVDRLVDSVEADPHPRFRHRCLEALVNQYPSDPKTRTALAHALADTDPVVRLLAAQNLASDAATQTLYGVLADTDSSIDVRLQALDPWIERQSDKTDTAERLSAVIAKAQPALRGRLFEVAVGSTLELPPDAFEHRPADDAMAAFCEALESAAPPNFEAILIGCLDRDHAVRSVAVADCLSRLGTIESVPALRRCTEGLLTDGDLKRAATAAIEAIQRRAGSAPRGSLALAQGDRDMRGQLSVESNS